MVDPANLGVTSGASRPLFSRRVMLRCSVAIVLAGPLLTAPAHALDPTPPNRVERLIASALSSAGRRNNKNWADIASYASKMGGTVARAAPRSTPLLKALALASPVGRAITIIGTIALAYDAVKDIWNAAPRQGVTNGEWDGNNPRCTLGQVCQFSEVNGDKYTVITTIETGANSSTWTYNGKYYAMKNQSLGAAAAPYKYQVWWKVPFGDTPKVYDPVPESSTDKKPTIAPGSLSEYLKQFENEQPDPAGFATTINDIAAKTEAYEGLAPNTIPRVTQLDVTSGLQTGVGTVIKDFTTNSPADRDFVIPVPGVNPGTGVVTDPGTDPGTDPAPQPGTGTGGNTGGGGTAMTDGQLDLGEAPDPGDIADTPNPLGPDIPLLSGGSMEPGLCPVVEGTWKGNVIRVDQFCTWANQQAESLRTVFRTVYMGMAAAILWRI